MEVIIVGNGTSVLNKKHDKLIDGHDIVIRLGGYVTEGYEEFVGIKTDIWSNGVSTIKIWKYFDENIINRHLWVMIPEDISTEYEYLKQWKKEKYSDYQFSQHVHNERLEKLKKNNMVECVKDEYLKILLKELNIFKYYTIGYFLRPSLGICTIFTALQKYNHVNLIGFDYLRSGWYWDVNHIHTIGKHNSLMEKIWIEKMNKIGKINIYE